MRLPTDDQANKLIDLIRSEQKELSGLEKKLAALKPVWQKQQRVCCDIEALRTAHDGTYTRAAEPFFQDYAHVLKAEAEEAVARRDSLIGDIPQQILSVRDRIFRRMRALAGALNSFVGNVTSHTLDGGSRPQCSPQLQGRLLAACKEAENLTDPVALFDLIESTAKIVETEDGLQAVPLLRLDLAVRQAAAIGVEVPNSPA